VVEGQKCITPCKKGGENVHAELSIEIQEKCPHSGVSMRHGDATVYTLYSAA